MVRILKPIQASWIDYPDDESIALVVVMMGCDNGCFKCQNPDFQNPYFKEMTEEVEDPSVLEDLLKSLSERYRTDKVVLSGGDPLMKYNIEFTKAFLKQTSFKVCIYTGHDLNWVRDHYVKGFEFIKCGKFEYANRRESQKTDECMVFASPNQQLYDKDLNLLSKDGVYYFN